MLPFPLNNHFLKYIINEYLSTFIPLEKKKRVRVFVFAQHDCKNYEIRV